MPVIRGGQSIADLLPKFKAMAAAAGRDPASVPLTTFGAPEDVDQLKRFRDLGISRVIVTLDSEKSEKILPILDRWAGVIRQLNG
jgi:MoaA/NifB/PqqE/SkfB family radical SAM enzyme